VRIQDEAIAGIKQQLSDRPGPILLLGLTPGLIDLGPELTAIDADEAAIRDRWPGDTPTRRAIFGNWLAPPVPPAAFASCVGDGTVNALSYPDDVAKLYGAVARILRPAGRFVCRVFAMPDVGETVAAVKAAALRGEIRRFMAFKFRLAMAACAEQGNPNIAVQAIHDAFEANFSDRDRLAAAGGWKRAEVDTIDVYRSSQQVYSFPTRQQCLSIVPVAFANARFVPVGTYELAERYPLLVMEKATA
jgi:SAM-dependent methyltransferase